MRGPIMDQSGFSSIGMNRSALIMPTSSKPVSPTEMEPEMATDQPGESAYHAWKRTNTVMQRQPGYAAAIIKLQMGDITSAADERWWPIWQSIFQRQFADYDQSEHDLALDSRRQLEALYRDLESQGLAAPGAELVEDIIACPGTDTCGLGITSSKGLGSRDG